MMMMKGQQDQGDQGMTLSRASSSAASSFLEECIGCESCLDLNTHTEHHLLHLFPAPYCHHPNEELAAVEVAAAEEANDDDSSGISISSSSSSNSEMMKDKEKEEERTRKMKKKKKEYPPPIPLLARTENLASHMPWVLKRHYTNDGRLILTEEKVWRHHEYFRAHRSDGRLTLQLVPLDDDHNDQDDDDDARNDEVEFKNLGYDDDGDDNDNDDGDEEGGFHRVGNAVKCLNYSSSVMMRGSPGKCNMYGVPLFPTLRTVLG